jgi:hypothetical protein
MHRLSSATLPLMALIAVLVPSFASAADPPVRYLPLPIKVEGEVVKSDFYLEAKVDETPAALAVDPAKMSDETVLAQVIEAAKKKDVKAYTPFSANPPVAATELELISGYVSPKRIKQITRRFDFGGVRYYVLQQDKADRFVPLTLADRDGQPKVVMSAVPTPPTTLLYEFVRTSFQNPQFAPAEKTPANQQIDLTLVEGTRPAKLHFKGDPVTFQIGGKDAPAPKAPERIMPVLQFFQSHMAALQAADQNTYLSQLGPESRKAFEQMLKESGPDTFKRLAPMGSYASVKYVIETNGVFLLFAHGPHPKPEEPLHVITIRPRPAGGYERINEDGGGAILSVLESMEVSKQLLQLAK